MRESGSARVIRIVGGESWPLVALIAYKRSYVGPRALPSLSGLLVIGMMTEYDALGLMPLNGSVDWSKSKYL